MNLTSKSKFILKVLPVLIILTGCTTTGGTGNFFSSNAGRMLINQSISSIPGTGGIIGSVAQEVAREEIHSTFSQPTYNHSVTATTETEQVYTVNGGNEIHKPNLRRCNALEGTGEKRVVKEYSSANLALGQGKSWCQKCKPKFVAGM